jgi:hypothetical protein
MSNINPNCDRSHCRHGYKEVRQYPPAPSTGSREGAFYLCLPCFAQENTLRLHRAKKTGRPEDWPQVSWATAEVVYDVNGKPFDAEAALRQGIVNYHQSGDGNGNE